MAAGALMSSAARAVAASSAPISPGGRSSSRNLRFAARRISGASLNVRRNDATTHLAFASEGGAGGEAEEVATSSAATDATADVPSTVNDMQDMLQALMAENQALQGKIEELGPPASVEGDAAAAAAFAAAEEPVLVRAPLAPGELLTVADEASITWPTPDEAPPFWDRRLAPMPLPAVDDACEGFQPDPNPLHVVHVTAEMAPIAKVGGLGDVVTGLAHTHLCAGHNVEVILPFYSSLSPDDIGDLQHVMDFDVPKGSETEWDGVRTTRMENVSTSMHTGVIGGCNVILLKPAARERSNIFVGGRIYGGSYNETEAYLYFCRASLECLRVTGRDPHVLHVHEWQCSAVAMLYWDLYYKVGSTRALTPAPVDTLQTPPSRPEERRRVLV